MRSGPTELVWSGAERATAVGANGQLLQLGEDWSAASLFALAVESDLMSTFVRLAHDAALPLLGYVSASSVDATEKRPRLSVSVCLVIADGAFVAAARELWRSTCATAPIAALLEGQLTTELAINVIGSENESTCGA